MIIVTKAHFPGIHRLLVAVDLGQGAINRFSPVPYSYEIPSSYGDQLDAINRFGMDISDDDLVTLAEGEEQEMQAAAAKSEASQLAFDLMGDYYNGEYDS